jgi:uncharacterized membrane protein YeaQ/YmgE (transglycosylase-associated protein family)
MNFIAWIIMGLLAGAIAKAIVPGNQGGGWLATLVLGIVGSFIGGSLYSFIQDGNLSFTSTELSIPGVFVAVLGAIIAIFIYGAINRQNPNGRL